MSWGKLQQIAGPNAERLVKYLAVLLPIALILTLIHFSGDLILANKGILTQALVSDVRTSSCTSTSLRGSTNTYPGQELVLQFTDNMGISHSTTFSSCVETPFPLPQHVFIGESIAIRYLANNPITTIIFEDNFNTELQYDWQIIGGMIVSTILVYALWFMMKRRRRVKQQLSFSQHVSNLHEQGSHHRNRTFLEK